MWPIAVWILALLIAAGVTQLVFIPLARRWLRGRASRALDVVRAVLERHPDMRLLAEEPPKLGFYHRSEKASLELVPPALEPGASASESGLDRQNGVTATTYFLPRPAPRLLLATKDDVVVVAGEPITPPDGYPGSWTIVAADPAAARGLLTPALCDAVSALAELWLADVALSLHDRRLTVQTAGWLTRDAALLEEALVRMNAVADAIRDELDRFTGDYRSGR